MSQIQMIFVIWAAFGVVALSCLVWISLRQSADDEGGR